MAGMFYSSEETAGKLNITIDQLKDFVTQGKLREFRDGSNLLFKAEEVEALVVHLRVQRPEELQTAPEPSEEAEIDITEEKVELPEDNEEMPSDQAGEPVAQIKDTDEGDEILLVPDQIDESSEAEQLSDSDTVLANEAVSLGEKTSGMDQKEGVGTGTGAILEESAIEDILLAGTNQKKPAPDAEGSTFGDLEDTLGGSTGKSGAGASLEQIDEDVNLDSFGSGSGLLDLSLQADDTSLGGILDEIYTADEVADGKPEQEEPLPDKVAVETEDMFPETVQPVSMAQGMAVQIETPADSVSKAFGVMLFVPLIVLIYTAIVTISGFSFSTPDIFQKIQGMIWYIMGGAAVLSLLIIGVPFLTASGSGAGKTAKPKKPKVKKPKKEKKAKGKKKAAEA